MEQVYTHCPRTEPCVWIRMFFDQGGVENPI